MFDLRVWIGKLPPSTRSVLETVLAGVVGALTALIFHHAIQAIYGWIWVSLSAGPVWQFAVVGFFVFAAVGLAGGFLLGHFAPEAAGSGIPQVKVAYWRDMGKIPFRIVWVKFLAGAISVGGGLSLGREGPTVQLASGLASVMGGKLGLINFRRRTITACGAAAGLAAAFNAPIAAVTFVLEEIIEDLNSRSIGPILLASFASVFTLYMLQGDDAAFVIPGMPEFHAWTYLAALPVGAVAALVGVGFQKTTLGWMAHIRQTSRLPLWGRPLVGAMINWAVACVVFATVGRTGVLGLGYEDLTECLHGNILLPALVVLLLAKWLATTSAYAWGNCGGIFAPTLFLGAMAGGLCGKFLEVLTLLGADDTRVLTVVGMSACLGAVVRAPITSILIVFEMTHDFALVPPLMMAALVSQGISRAMCRENFYNQALLDSGVEMEQHIEVRSLSDWKKRRVATFANFHPKSVRAWTPESVGQLIESSGYAVYPVVDRQGRVEGVVRREGLEAFLNGGVRPVVQEAVCVSPEDALKDIEMAIVEAPLNILLLVTPEKNLLGLFTLHDLLRSQMREKDSGEE